MTFQERADSEMAEGNGGAGASPTMDSLYRAHSGAIRKHIERQFGGGPPDPEEAVQAAFTKFAAIADRSTILQPLAFLKRCAYNFVIDFHREQKLATRAAADVHHLAETCDFFDAERVLAAKQRAAIVESALRNMDERRREVLLMSRVHGLNAEEIAQRLGVSRTLVRVRLTEAVALCQKALRNAGEP